MTSVKIASLCAVFFIVSCMVAITPTLAANGPFYKIAGTRLRNGVSAGIQIKMTNEPYVLKATISGTPISVRCTGSKLIDGPTINGSNGANGSTSKERLELTGCTQTGNAGVGCAVTGGIISTAPLTNTLGYSEAERKGKIQFLFKPTTGTEIATVSFTATCTLPSAELKGSLVAEALIKTEAVEVGKETAEEVVEINFPPALISQIWIETGGSVKAESTSLRWAGEAGTTFEGGSALWLTSRNNWGLYTSSNKTATKFLAAEWLVAGAAVTAELSTETTSELLLEDSKTKVVVLCSGILDGWIGTNSLGWVSEVLNLSGEAISTTPLTGLALECTAQEGCESSSAAKVWPVNLGWETEVDLMEQSSTFFDLSYLPHSGGSNPGWELECLVIGLSMTDECTASQSASELSLEGTSLLDKFSSAFAELAEAKLATCSVGGEESGVIEGEGTIALKAGGELTASSEGTVS